MAEQWKPIPEFKGYEVSNKGRVRSFYRRGTAAGWTISDEPVRILRPGAHPGGYATVLLCKDRKKHLRRIAGLVLLAFVGPRPPGTEVCHNDGDPTNDRLENLRYDTHAENMQDAIQHGTIQSMSPEIIREIRERRHQGESLASLASAHDRSRKHISGICAGRCYPDVGGPITKGNGLNNDTVRAIRAMRNDGATYRQVGDTFGLTTSGAWRICKRERYAHVE